MTKPPPSKINRDPHFKLTEDQRKFLVSISSTLKPALRVGREDGLSVSVVAKAQAHLSWVEIIKVEFVKVTLGKIKEFSAALAEETKSEVIVIHGNFAVLFKKHLNTSFDDFMQARKDGR